MLENSIFLSTVIFTNTIESYLLSFAVFLATIGVLLLFKRYGIKKIKGLTQKTETDFDDHLIELVESIGWPFYVILSVFASFQFINIHHVIEKAFSYLIFVVIVFYVVKIIQGLLRYFIISLAKKKNSEGKKGDVSIIKLIGDIIKWSVWLIAVLLILQNFGLDITALIAGIGIGGIAIAFALQSILEDMFSCFSIYFDKPFEAGDYIVIGTESGTVKKVGIKSTRIRTLQGEELVVSNKELTAAQVRNFKKLEKRRSVIELNIAMDTTSSKLKKITPMVQKIIEDIDLAVFSRSNFKLIGPYSYVFEVVFFVNAKEYSKYMEILETINYSIKESLEKEKIKLTYPVQRVVLDKN